MTNPRANGFGSGSGLRENMILCYQDQVQQGNNISTLSLGNESYIMDLANQKANREQLRKEEAMEEAIELFQIALERGAQDTKAMFFAIFQEVERELAEQYKDVDRLQDERLEAALELELERRNEAARQKSNKEKGIVTMDDTSEMKDSVERYNNEEQDDNDDDELLLLQKPKGKKSTRTSGASRAQKVVDDIDDQIEKEEEKIIRSKLNKVETIMEDTLSVCGESVTQSKSYKTLQNKKNTYLAALGNDDDDGDDNNKNGNGKNGKDRKSKKPKKRDLLSSSSHRRSSGSKFSKSPPRHKYLSSSPKDEIPITSIRPNIDLNCIDEMGDSFSSLEEGDDDDGFGLPEPDEIVMTKISEIQIAASPPTPPTPNKKDKGNADADVKPKSSVNIIKNIVPTIPDRTKSSTPKKREKSIGNTSAKTLTTIATEVSCSTVDSNYSTLDDFKSGKASVPNMDAWETYLSPDEFQLHFQMTLADYEAMPKWKQAKIKRKVRTW